jgi:hypothetical protein
MKSAFDVAVRMVDAGCYGRLPKGTTQLLADRACRADEARAIDAIRALQHVGRAPEVKTLERLAGPKQTPGRRAAAAEALAAVKQRIVEESERSTLVRGSSAAPGDLLRAVSEPEEKVAELLIAAKDPH